MKKRVRQVVNFFAFNLLFFALYLNFIHKDKVSAAATSTGQQNASVLSGNVPAENPEKYLNTKADVTTQQPVSGKTEQKNTATLKLSAN